MCDKRVFENKYFCKVFCQNWYFFSEKMSFISPIRMEAMDYLVPGSDSVD